MSLANSSLLEGESLPSRWSDDEHESIRVCAITDRFESTVGVLWMSTMKLGFLMKFTQKRSGRQLDFQACTTSGSAMLNIKAASSRMSNIHLIETAIGFN